MMAPKLMNRMNPFLIMGCILLVLVPTSFSQLSIHHAFEIEMQTQTNVYYRIQNSSNMVSWANCGDEIFGTGAPVFQLVSTRGKAQEFYRFVSSSSNTQMTIDIPSYANLCGSWVYDRTSWGYPLFFSTWGVKVLGTKTEQGRPVYLLQEYDEDGYLNDQEFMLTDMSKGLFQTGGLDDYGTSTQEKWYWEPSSPRLMKTFIPGMEYTNSITRTDIPEVIMQAVIKTEAETVSVPYGTFDCLKVTRTFSAPSLTYVEKAWYAKHLGLVKRDNNGEDLWELSHYQP